MTRLAVVLAVVAFGAAGAAGAYADDDNKKKDSEQVELERSQREDHETAGQVLDINTLADPPEMKLGSTDGVITVKVVKKDEIARNGVRLGDHVSVVGEKIHE